MVEWSHEEQRGATRWHDLASNLEDIDVDLLTESSFAVADRVPRPQRDILPLVEGSYRDEIVESEVQRLARVREPYARRWAALAWRRRLVWHPIPFVVGAGVAIFWFESLGHGVLVVTCWLVGAAGIAASWLGVILTRTTTCPRCKRRYFGPYKRRPEELYRILVWEDVVCDNCRLPFGYLPAVEDLDEPQASAASRSSERGPSVCR